MKRRVDIAVQQVAVWQAAAEATAQLKAAQEQKAAQAARHSQKVTPSSLIACPGIRGWAKQHCPAAADGHGWVRSDWHAVMVLVKLGSYTEHVT